MLIVTKRAWEFYSPKFKLVKGANRVEQIPPRLVPYFMAAKERGEVEITDEEGDAPVDSAPPAPTAAPAAEAPATTPTDETKTEETAAPVAEDEVAPPAAEESSDATCAPGDEEDPSEEEASAAPAAEAQGGHQRGGRRNRR